MSPWLLLPTENWPLVSFQSAATRHTCFGSSWYASHTKFFDRLWWLRFRAMKNAQALRNSVTFNWEMVASDGSVAVAGLEFLVVDELDRILVDYQFIVQ